MKTPFFRNVRQWQGGKGSTMRWHVITRNCHAHSRTDDTFQYNYVLSLFDIAFILKHILSNME